MALVKLPFVSVVLIAFKASITAPNPPPDATERIFSEWYTEILKSKISLVLLSVGVPRLHSAILDICCALDPRMASGRGGSSYHC